MLEHTESRVELSGGEGQTTFPIPFPFLDSRHIAVVVRDSDGTRRRLTAGTDYSIASTANHGGELTLMSPLEKTQVLEISRTVPLTQEIQFHNQGPNSPKATEEAIDKLTMIAQQHADELSTRISAPDNIEPEAFVQTMQKAITDQEHVQSSLNQLSATLSLKAERTHQHTSTAITGLADLLDTKANNADMTAALAAKAPTNHLHSLSSITGLNDALQTKADASALDAYANVVHAQSHGATGTDRLHPVDIGALPLPPADGKTYLATAAGWVEYTGQSGTEPGGSDTADHMLLVNREKANQHPQSAIEHLDSDMQLLRDAIATVESTSASLQSALSNKADVDQLPVNATPESSGLLTAFDKTKLDRLPADPATLASRQYVADALQPQIERLDGLENATLPDAPADNKQYARSNNAWTQIAASGSGGGFILGEIRLLPFRSAELPEGWHFCNGDRFPLSSAVGNALANLSATFKLDWGISADEETINVPSLFSGADGYFLRPANNTSRMPGSVQQDAIRNITGTALSRGGSTVGFLSAHESTGGKVTGAFVLGPNTAATVNMSATAGYELGFDASAAVPTAEENRPVNIAMTPAMYLGA